MQVLATLPPGEAQKLMEFLKDKQIPCETAAKTQESGLEVLELAVEEDRFEQACDAAEQWEAARAIESKKAWKVLCPKCRSLNWEQVEDPDYQKVDLAVFRCKDCGEVFSR